MARRHPSSGLVEAPADVTASAPLLRIPLAFHHRRDSTGGAARRTLDACGIDGEGPGAGLETRADHPDISL